MGSAALGSAPKANFSTQPTIQPVQMDMLDMLSALFTTGNQPAGVTQYGGSYAAPLNSLQQTSLAGLEQAAMGGTGPTSQQSGQIDKNFNSLNSGLNFKAPTIDSTDAFQQGVVDPLTQNFTSKVLPSLDARAAGSAGGAYSSGRQQGNLTAADDFTRTLGQEGSRFALGAAQANQTAELQANQQRLAALGLAPAITQQPTQLESTGIEQLLATLGGGAVPYNVAQTQVQGQYGEFQRQQEQVQQFIKDLIAAATGQTQTTIGVGTGGSSGFLAPLLGAAGTAAGGYLKSDERFKEDVEQIGDVDGIPLYRYRYKGEPERRLGFLAHEVERQVPEAVARDSRGYKYVNYERVLTDVLEAA